MRKKVSQLKCIAGVGASAGGLEALLSLFSKTQPGGQVGFVVAQHMAKDGHDELVVRLINRESLLPVVLATDGIQLSPDHVYIIPSGKDGRVVGERLHLMEPHSMQISTPSVNVLLTSLAEAEGASAIGIILSGTGSDGAAGCKAIKARGGSTLAQDMDEAKFNGMPSAAVAAQAIDQILSVDQMAQFLFERFAPKDIVKKEPAMLESSSPELETLCKQVHKATGIDFSGYKEETLLRRLEKRKATLGISKAEDYQRLVSVKPQELHDLQQLFLVSVSSFFRDRESFDVLKSALEKLIRTKNAGESIRVWVAGCATGEEAITLAILLKELTLSNPIQITASDLNPEALAVCREGIYRTAGFKEMDSSVRSKYFSEHGEQFEIRPEIKSCIQFEQCDILEYMPPVNLDLVTCRNLLIYLKSSQQDKVIQKFYNCLSSQGLLFIGQSESLSFIGNALFIPVDNYHRLYKKR